jgi:hypothetical protein
MSRATYVVEIEMRELHTICELPRLRAFVEVLLRIASSGIQTREMRILR